MKKIAAGHWILNKQEYGAMMRARGYRKSKDGRHWTTETEEEEMKRIKRERRKIKRKSK